MSLHSGNKHVYSRRKYQAAYIKAAATAATPAKTPATFLAAAPSAEETEAGAEVVADSAPLVVLCSHSVHGMVVSSVTWVV